MCIRDRRDTVNLVESTNDKLYFCLNMNVATLLDNITFAIDCLLYTSDAADERSSVDLGGRRIIKKKKHRVHASSERYATKSRRT